MVVVIIMLSILATVALPRLTGGRARRAEQEARAVASLLTAMAERESLSTSGVALVYDADAARVTMLVKRPAREAAAGANAGSSTASTTNITGNSGDEWLVPPLLQPVTLSQVRLVNAALDGVIVPVKDLRIECSGAQTRPMIDLLLRLDGAGTEGGGAWQVTLDPSRSSAVVRVVGEGGAFVPTLPESIDLDAQGRRTSSW